MNGATVLNELKMALQSSGRFTAQVEYTVEQFRDDAGRSQFSSHVRFFVTDARYPSSTAEVTGSSRAEFSNLSDAKASAALDAVEVIVPLLSSRRRLEEEDEVINLVEASIHILADRQPDVSVLLRLALRGLRESSPPSIWPEIAAERNVQVWMSRLR